MQHRTRIRKRQTSGITRTLTTDATGAVLARYEAVRSSSYTLSEISDVGGAYRGQKPCEHTRIQMNDCSFTLPRAKRSDQNTFYEIDVASVWSHYSTLGVGGFSMPDLQFGRTPYYTDALNELMRDASGAMPASVNLVVNAVEFASVKTLIPQIFKIGGNLLKNKLGRKSLKELANGHLLYSFGVVPLISDIKGLLNVRKSVQKRICELEARNCRTVRITKRCAPDTQSSTYSGSFSVYPEHLVNYQGTVEATIGGAVSADCTAFYNTASPESQCKLWASALGLSTPLQSIWELIPFSFVWDWFVPIGSTFQRLEDKLGLSETAVSYRLSNFTHSRTIESRTTGSGVVASGLFPSWNGRKQSIPTFSGRHYVRQQGIPSDGRLIPPLGWSLGKTALSLSLTAQKVLK